MLNTRLNLLKHWIVLREGARKNKELMLSKPWSDDEIIQQTRFCNVRRMDDKVSKWLLHSWYPSFSKEDNSILAAAGLARLINWPDSLNILISQEKTTVFNKNNFIKQLQDHKKAKNKIFTGAYIVTAAGYKDKIDGVLNQVEALYNAPSILSDKSNMSTVHTKLQEINGIGSFIAGQIVADLRHILPDSKNWTDKHYWAPMGPGSRRGIAWLNGWNGTDKLEKINQVEFEIQLTKVINFLDENLDMNIKELNLEAHDFQNCLCEFDKYMRLLNKTGRAKNKYLGS